MTPNGGDGFSGRTTNRLPGPSARPALIPVGIAALVLLVGGIGAALTSSGSAQPAPKTSLPTVRGAGIKAVPGERSLAPIITSGEPPRDILNVVPLPEHSSVKSGSAANNTVGLYDHSLSFSVDDPEQKVIVFYRAELKALKWQLVGQGPPPHGAAGYQIVGQHPSSDGYEWEIGVTVSPTTFGSGSNGAVETTPFTVRLFAVTDD